MFNSLPPAPAKIFTRASTTMAPHSSTLAWKIPWTEEPGRLQFMRLLRVGHDWVTSLSLFTFHFHALEEEMATHSSVLAWRIPGTAGPGGLPSMGSHRVGHHWSDLAAAAVPLLHSLKFHPSITPLWNTLISESIYLIGNYINDIISVEKDANFLRKELLFCGFDDMTSFHFSYFKIILVVLRGIHGNGNFYIVLMWSQYEIEMQKQMVKCLKVYKLINVYNFRAEGDQAVNFI